MMRNSGLQLSLFDDRDMASITSPDFPGERLIVCRNPELAAKRAHKRRELLEATERDLARIRTAVARQRNPLRGKAEIGLAVGAVIVMDVGAVVSVVVVAVVVGVVRWAVVVVVVAVVVVV